MPPLKPPVAVRPSALLRARSTQVLAPRAEEMLLRVAEVLTEGRAAEGTFYGTTLVRFDLKKLGVDRPAAEVLSPIEGSVRLRLKIARLAMESVARRHPDAYFGTATLETRFRAEGDTVLADVEIEVPLSAPRSRSEGEG